MGLFSYLFVALAGAVDVDQAPVGAAVSAAQVDPFSSAWTLMLDGNGIWRAAGYFIKYNSDLGSRNCGLLFHLSARSRGKMTESCERRSDADRSWETGNR
jgi:hypothetical protein